MSEDDATTDETPKKKSKLPLILGLILGIAGGAGGFFLGSNGMLTSKAIASNEVLTDESREKTVPSSADLKAIAFVEVPPLLISLQPGAHNRNLRFRASLEVPAIHQDAVTNVLPRISDVFNSYLRALEPEDIEARGSLLKIRSQMMHRVDLVVGNGIVNDLLVMEFILN